MLHVFTLINNFIKSEFTGCFKKSVTTLNCSPEFNTHYFFAQIAFNRKNGFFYFMNKHHCSDNFCKKREKKLISEIAKI